MKTTLSVDARKRVTLPPNAGIKPGDDMEIELLDDGRMILTPIVRIPRHQMWAWSERVDRLLVEASVDSLPKVRVTEPGVLEEMAKSYGISI
jgi:hypothetical protein